MHLPSRHGTVVRNHQACLTAWLKSHPGKQRTSDAAKKCKIPKGTLYSVLRHPNFTRHAGGFLSLAQDAAAIKATPPKYKPELLASTRWAIYAELSIREPQTTDELVRELKYDRMLIEQAIQWHRFTRTTKGGWVIGPVVSHKGPRRRGCAQKKTRSREKPRGELRQAKSRR